MNLILVASLLSAPEAYIDPSTGGMLFQILAVVFAFFSGILFFFSRQIRMYIARLRRMIRGEKEPEADIQSQDQTSTDKTQE